jgi:phytoene synthase
MSSNPSSHAVHGVVRRSRSNLAFALACLPRGRRNDMYSFYAFCRVVDDIADDEGIPLEQRIAGLQRWRDVIHGRATNLNELEEAVTGVQERHQPPVEEMEEIIEGVSMDLEPRRYATWADLERYCYRVAGCVGLVSIRIFGCVMPQSRDYALALGNALQITNILRDIHGDYENGQRIYLPQEDMAAAGYTEAELARGKMNDAFQTLMTQQIARARDYYARATALLMPEDRVPLSASETMRRIYSETLDLLDNDGRRVFDKRYRLPHWRKVQIVGSAWITGVWTRAWKAHTA